MINKWLASLLAVIIAIGLWHGVPVPSFVYEPALQWHTRSKPYEIKAQGVVASVLPSPRVRLLQMQLAVKADDTLSNRSTLGRPDREQPLLIAPLLTLDWAWRQLIAGNRSPERLLLTEPTAWLQTDDDGRWNVLQLSSGTGQGALTRVEITGGQAQIRSEALQGKVTIDRVVFDPNGQTQSTLGIRWLPLGLAGDEAVNSLNIRATGLIRRLSHPSGQSSGTISDHQRFNIESLELEAKGPLDHYPWYGTLAIQSMTLGLGPSPSVSVQDIRAYVRRDDDPDSHQASVSAKRAHLNVADGRLQVKQGQWSYTDHAAQSWSFDAQADFARRVVSFSPTQLQGSESMPVQPSQWSLICTDPDRIRTRTWRWVNGWIQEPRPYLGRKPARTNDSQTDHPGDTAPGIIGLCQ